MHHRTRIKICGLTREADVAHTVAAGADAIGFVLYPPSPRAVSIDHMAKLVDTLPAFVTPVLLFVNASPSEVRAACAVAPQALLQFHGDETPAYCAQFKRPYLRAARIPTGAAGAGFDLIKYATEFADAQAILLDAHIEGYGGGGLSFDWTAFPWSHPQLSASSRLVLSGGLTLANVADGIRLVQPWAVDVSSGVEAVGADGTAVKGIKDPERVAAFMAAVRQADAQR